MPTCKKCNNNFPNRIIVEGKEKYLNSRSYCLDCSPLGPNSGYDLRRANTELKYKETLVDSAYLQCLICNRQYERKRKNNLVCSTCRANYTRLLHKRKGVELLGGKCSKCDIDDIKVLQFHHTDPSIKEFTLGGAWSSKDWQILEKEIKKCVLLCANCHIKEHRKDLTAILNHYEPNKIP